MDGLISWYLSDGAKDGSGLLNSRLEQSFIELPSYPSFIDTPILVINV